MITDLLFDLFKRVDTDGSGTVSREEFNAMLKRPDLMRKLTKNTRVRIQDLQELFEWLDHDGGGTITIDEFMAGFKWVNEPLRAKSLVKLQERLAGDLKSLEQAMQAAFDRRFGELTKLVMQPLRRVHAITEQMQNLDIHFRDLRHGLESQTAEQPTQTELRGVETRLMTRMDGLLARLEEIERSALASVPQAR